jgi:hypothetical protein
MEALQTKYSKAGPDTEIYAFLGFSNLICFGHFFDIRVLSHESLDQHTQRHDFNSIWTMGVLTWKFVHF